MELHLHLQPAICCCGVAPSRVALSRDKNESVARLLVQLVANSFSRLRQWQLWGVCRMGKTAVEEHQHPEIFVRGELLYCVLHCIAMARPPASGGRLEHSLVILCRSCAFCPHCTQRTWELLWQHAYNCLHSPPSATLVHLCSIKQVGKVTVFNREELAAVSMQIPSSR